MHFISSGIEDSWLGKEQLLNRLGPEFALTREYQTDQSSLNLPRLLPALSSRRSKGNYKTSPQTSQN
jgi:hypothetical protein